MRCNMERKVILSSLAQNSLDWLISCEVLALHLIHKEMDHFLRMRHLIDKPTGDLKHILNQFIDDAQHPMLRENMIFSSSESFDSGRVSVLPELAVLARYSSSQC